MAGTVACAVCDGQFKAITNTHLRSHGIGTAAYVGRYGTAGLTSDATVEKCRANSTSLARNGIIGLKRGHHINDGRAPWNKGRTAAEDQRIASYGAKLRGRVMSVESRRKLSAAKLGGPGLSGPANPAYGKTYRLGKHHTLETRRRLSVMAIGRTGLSGPANPAWRGGITPETTRARSTPAVRRWRVRIHKKYGHKCYECGSTKYLDAHHIIKVRDRPDMSALDNNGVLLCRLCHRKYEDIPGRFDMILNYDEYEPYVSASDDAGLGRCHTPEKFGGV